jgi:hypothetical protein
VTGPLRLFHAVMRSREMAENNEFNENVIAQRFLCGVNREIVV